MAYLDLEVLRKECQNFGSPTQARKLMRPKESLTESQTRWIVFLHSRTLLLGLCSGFREDQGRSEGMENPEEEEDDLLRQPQRQQSQKTVIKIPSYQEVIDSSQSKSGPPSLFCPSPTFSQAFSFIKSSEFYSPPPPPPPPAATGSQSSPLGASISGYPPPFL